MAKQTVTYAEAADYFVGAALRGLQVMTIQGALEEVEAQGVYEVTSHLWGRCYLPDRHAELIMERLDRFELELKRRYAAFLPETGRGKNGRTH